MMITSHSSKAMIRPVTSLVNQRAVAKVKQTKIFLTLSCQGP